MELMTYLVAGHRFAVKVSEMCRSWEQVKGHYAPFATEPGDCLFTLTIEDGEAEAEALADRKELFRDEQKDDGMMRLAVFETSDGGKIFEIAYPKSCQTDGWVFADAGRKNFRIVVSQQQSAARNRQEALWTQTATLTTGALLCFMLATNGSHTLTMHSSCVKKDGRGFLFLGKSGTGKSTHARLWLSNIGETLLLNDDHPIVRLDDDGRAVVYGSPWSGKTDCYVNDQAEIGAIVKIEQAPMNRIRRLPVVEAYSKLMVSASGMTWEAGMAAARHTTIERIIASVPCYELECLPNDEAARVCFQAVCK